MTFISALMIVPMVVSVWAKPPILRGKEYWQKRDKMYQRVLKKRQIAVKVRHQKNLAKAVIAPHRLLMDGIGLMNVPQSFAYRQTLKFDDFKEMSEYIVESRFNKETKVFFMHTQAFGYHAQMWISLVLPTTSKSSGPTTASKKIRFHVIRGTLKGINGTLSLDSVGARQTEIVLSALFDYKKSPFPAIFLQFGLELVLEKMAARMRGHIEEKFRQKQSG